MTSGAVSRSWQPAAIDRSAQIPSLARFQGRRFLIFPMCGLALFAVYIALLLIAPMNPIVQRQITSEAGQILSLLFVISMCLWVSTRVPSGRTQWAWRCFTLAFTTYVIAESIFGYEGIVIFAGQSTPTPTLADAFYLPFYPLMATGLLLLPSTPLSGSSRLRTIVEACITSAALLALVLIYLIAPNFLQGGQPPITIGVLVAYPLGDSILILTLIFLLSRGVQANYRPVFFFITLGLISFIYADVSFDYFGLQGTYSVGAVNVDPFWALGELIMSLAPLYFLVHGEKLNAAWTWIYNLAPQAATTSLATSIRRFVLPYISVLLLVILLAVNHPALPGVSIYPSLEILTLIVVVLIVARQILIGLDLVDAQVEKTRAQQLDSLKNQFITSVNHELRTPLMTMQAYVELLRIQQSQMKPADREIIIEEVGRTNDALVDLVQSILEVRRLDQEATDFPREAVPVRATLEKAVALINPSEGRISERNLRAQVARDLTIWGEPVRVQQILTNLLSNAIKYSPPDTAIEVTASLAEMNQRRRRRQDRPMVEITVRDHGLGIPPDQIPLLFNRFVRLQRDLASKVVGSGLGLFLCKTLAEAMDGRIWVESTGVEGEGSTFHVLLPAAPALTSFGTDDKETTLPRPVVQIRS